MIDTKRKRLTKSNLHLRIFKNMLVKILIKNSLRTLGKSRQTVLTIKDSNMVRFKDHKIWLAKSRSRSSSQLEIKFLTECLWEIWIKNLKLTVHIS
jgi:hypothetical protein